MGWAGHVARIDAKKGIYDVIGKVRGKVMTRKIKKQVKNGVFWDVTPCGSCKNRRFGGT
jgi:hypothetical protein